MAQELTKLTCALVVTYEEDLTTALDVDVARDLVSDPAAEVQILEGVPGRFAIVRSVRQQLETVIEARKITVSDKSAQSPASEAFLSHGLNIIRYFGSPRMTAHGWNFEIISKTSDEGAGPSVARAFLSDAAKVALSLSGRLQSASVQIVYELKDVQYTLVVQPRSQKPGSAELLAQLNAHYATGLPGDDTSVRLEMTTTFEELGRFLQKVLG